MAPSRDEEQRKRRTDSSSAPERTCKSCLHTISKKNNVFNCVACGDIMHLTKQCTGISEAAIMGIKEISHNVILICNECVKNNQRDTILSTNVTSRPSMTDEKITTMTEQFENFRKEMESIKRSVEDKKSAPKRPPHPEPTQLISRKPNAQATYDGIRTRGIEEMKSKDSRKRHEHDLEEVNKLFAFLTINAEVTDLKRLGKFEEDASKPRTIIVKLSNDWQKRLILVFLAKLKHYEKTVYVSKELSPNELLAENKLLKQRRELIDNAFPPRDLRIRELKLYKYEGSTWVQVESNEKEP